MNANSKWIIGILSAGLVAGLSACNDSGSGSTVSDASPAANTAAPGVNAPAEPVAAGPASMEWTEGPPQLTFLEPVHDFGQMNETETRTADITLGNTGGETLIVHDVKTTCGCTAASLSKRRLEPGETSSITVTFDPTGPNEPGQPQRKYVRVFSNAVNAPSPDKPIEAMIVADVTPFLIFEPRLLQFGQVKLGEGATQVLRVQSPDEGFELVSVEAPNPNVRARILPEAEKPQAMVDGKRAEYIEFVVDPAAPWGGLYFGVDVTARGRPDLESDEVITHTASLRAAGKVFGELVTGQMDAFRFGVDPGDRFDRTVSLIRESGQPFEVLGATIERTDLPESSIKSVQVAPNQWDVILEGRGSSVPGYRHLNGRVIVMTDVPGEGRVELPIFGVVRQPQPGG